MQNSIDNEISDKLKSLANEARHKFTLARKGSLEALLNHKAVGDILIEVKALCPRGSLKWAKDHLDIGKQWVANLVFLSTNWADYETARSWAESNHEMLGRKEFGVEGAVALIKRYRKSLLPADQDTSAAPKRPSKVSQLKGEVETLKGQLVEVMQQNALLMAQLAETGITAPPKPLDEKIKDKVQKVGRLWHEGGTAGECETAEQTLRNMARDRGWLFEAFLKECGIERPVNWTEAKAA